jgi:hypothetical protein
VADDSYKDRDSRDFRPVPDPTLLTTEQLHREIAALREFVLGEIRHVGELSNERFKAVDEQFYAVSERTKEQKEDGRLALDAAFQSAKDAVALQTEASDKAIAKSEAATTKQIDALGIVVEKSSQAKDEKIEDLKSRLDKLEGRKEGISASTALILALVGALASIAVVITVVVALTQGGA